MNFAKEREREKACTSSLIMNRETAEAHMIKAVIPDNELPPIITLPPDVVEKLKAAQDELKRTPTPGPTFDPVRKPKHYNSHPSGVECITITEHMSFCLGNAIKYIWRAGLKPTNHSDDNTIQDLEKAKGYLEREIERRKHEQHVQINFELHKSLTQTEHESIAR